MSRNKPVLLLLMLALLMPHTACAAVSENLLEAQGQTQEAANYKTYTVETGVYERSYSASGATYYPYTYNLCFETEGAKFKEYTVKRNDTVKKGDVLALFTLDTDEVALSTQRLSLTRAHEALTEQRDTYQEEIDAIYESLLSTNDRYERDMLKLRIAYAEVSLEKYVYEQEQKIAGLEETIAELEEKNENNVLVAPADGVITNLTYIREGDRVSTTTPLITLYREEGMLIRVDNASNYLRYGMKVNVEVGAAKNRMTLTGTVVGADTLVPSSRRTNHAFIQLDPYDEDSVRMLNPVAKAPTICVDNVIVVPRSAVTLEGGKYYVTKYVDGTLQKRYVQYVTNTPTVTWLLQGLDAGETIIID